jgi:hypothetical protein
LDVGIHGDHGVNIRKATLEDLSTLVRFTAQEAEEAEGSIKNIKRLELGIRAALEDHSIAIYWVLADEADKPIGSISALREWSDWNAAYYWWKGLDEARAKGWTVVDMKQDWKVIYPHE